jgi:hypothetical protein
MRALMENRRGLADSLIAGPYALPALVPASPWLDARVPAAPALAVHQDAVGSWLTIAPGDDLDVRFWIVQLRTGGEWQYLPLAGDRRRVPLAIGTDRAVVYGVSRTGVEGTWAPVAMPEVVNRASATSP